MRAAITKAAKSSLTNKWRSYRQFAEAEIILPTGPFQDQRFKVDRQPWAGLWFDELDSGRWRRHALTGPSQTGKSLLGSALPVMYHLFECSETIIYGAPTLDMAADKWKQDILPVIAASRYRDLLPSGGQGSKGGTPTSIQFRHGPTLRFMTGGGNDKVRAGFTSRVVVATEVDGMDESSSSSRETDKISQLEARSNAFGDRARFYMECTVSTEEGRTWRELKSGTDSRIAMQCPHCRQWVTPEREHLHGWQDARDVSDAMEHAMLICPKCSAGWSEADRLAANHAAKLVHKGQAIEADGTIVGMLPRTHTLGFRFTAANNLLVGMPKVAEEEWTSPRNTDSASAEKKMRQFYWTLPSEPETVTLSELDTLAISKRAIKVPRGRVPSGVARITLGVDIGKWLCHWVALAWMQGGGPHVLEYGRLEVPSQSMAEELAIQMALRRFRDEICAIGWPSIGSNQMIRPAVALVDSGDWQSTVVSFCAESGAGYIPTKGFGIQQLGKRRISFEPGYEIVMQPAGYGLLEINADYWKSYVHARIQTPVNQPGALTLFHATPTEHLSFSKHLTAEKRVEEFVAGKGLVTRWEAVNRNNHFLDALSLACVAGHAAGERLVITNLPPATEEAKMESAESSTAKPWVNVNNWNK